MITIPDSPPLDLEPPFDPLGLLVSWLHEAELALEPEANAMVLATAPSGGQPSARMVLFKGLSAGRLRFFTNYESRKAHDLAENAQAALLFYWPRIYRQVRVEGTVERLSPEESDQYFASRARGSQLSAAASPQSQPIESRAWLEGRLRALELEVGEGPVPRPAGWGGFGLAPHAFEFWMGRPSRFHERVRLERDPAAGDASWRKLELAP